MPGFLEVFGHPAPDTPLGWNLGTVRQQLISSLMTLGAFLSSGTAGFVANYLSRRQCLWFACILCCVSNVIMMATTHIGALYLGRLLIGIANGYFMTFSQLYIQETSPAKYRGLFLSVFQFCTSFGTLIGTIINWRTAMIPGKPAYLIPLGLIYVVPVFICIGLFFIPESPRWLIMQGKHERGLKSLTWLRPKGADTTLEAETIRAGIEKERELGSEVGVLDMFRNPVDRRRTTLAVCAVTLQAASGAMFIIGKPGQLLFQAYSLTIR
jgi:MFS family permease